MSEALPPTGSRSERATIEVLPNIERTSYVQVRSGSR